MGIGPVMIRLITPKRKRAESASIGIDFDVCIASKSIAKIATPPQIRKKSEPQKIAEYLSCSSEISEKNLVFRNM